MVSSNGKTKEEILVPRFPEDLPFIVLGEFPKVEDLELDQSKVLVITLTGWYGKTLVDKNFLEDCGNLFKKFPNIVGIPTFCQTSTGMLAGILEISNRQARDLAKFGNRYQKGLRPRLGSGTITVIPPSYLRITNHIREVLAHAYFQMAILEKNTRSDLNYWKALRKREPNFPDPKKQLEWGLMDLPPPIFAEE